MGRVEVIISNDTLFTSAGNGPHPQEQILNPTSESLTQKPRLNVLIQTPLSSKNGYPNFPLSRQNNVMFLPP